MSEDADLHAGNEADIIRPVRHPRACWTEVAKKAHERGEDQLLDEPTPTRFDERHWQWEMDRSIR
ncbi:MAG: hypothetical protein NTW86_24765 [Candidatus Sumerlaeota bacterium]|nr:hypothetical protein [Candidatus Sumerlaeota bacterium]